MNRCQRSENICRHMTAWACALLVAFLSCGVVVSPVQAVPQSDAATARAQILDALRREGYLRQSTAMQRAKMERRKRLIKAALIFGVLVPGSVYVLYCAAKSMEKPKADRVPTGEDWRRFFEGVGAPDDGGQPGDERWAYCEQNGAVARMINVSAARRTLGIDESAEQKDIQRTYRQLAIQYHPDRNSGNETATQRMADINNARDDMEAYLRGHGRWQ